MLLKYPDRFKKAFANVRTAASAGGGMDKAIVKEIRELAPELKLATFTSEQIGQVQAEKKRTSAPLGSKGDVDPLELEDYVRTINMNYIGVRKIGPRLKRAAEIMRITGEKFTPALKASDPHELMRVLEVQDIIKLSELHAQASLLRTESRDLPSHYRIDYPEQDDVHWNDTIVTIESVAGEAKYKIERAE